MTPKIRAKSSIQIDLPSLDNISSMKTKHAHLANLALAAALCAALPAFADGPRLPGIDAAMQEMIAKNEIAGAVTVVVKEDKVLHLECTGFADVAAKRPMTPDTLFWIASMRSEERRVGKECR